MNKKQTGNSTAEHAKTAREIYDQAKKESMYTVDVSKKNKKLVQPITPADVVEAKQAILPNEVILSFNELIAEFWDGNASKFEQELVIARIQSKIILPDLNPIARAEIFHRKWLDVEPIYRKAGWIVEYDKPGHNESYNATFEFRKKE